MREPSLSAFGLMDVHEVAQVLGVSEVTVRRMRDEGRMPMSLRLGGRRTERWRRDVFIAWIEAGCPPISKPDTAQEGK